jgi:hypothetical protein
MAKLTAPLFSLGARGQLGKTLVYMAWKGINDVRQHVTPANPQTAAQTTQRDAMSAVVSAWRNYFTDATMRAAWNRLAGTLASVMSGFNAAAAAMVKRIVADPDASFAYSCAAAAGNAAAWTMKNLDDGAAGDEAGNFEVWVGDKKDALLYLETKAIAAGVITSSDLGDLDDVKYVKVRKDAVDRSGISEITLIA